MRSLVHPRLLDRLAQSFYPSRATVEISTDTRSPSGAVISAWAALPGLVGIPCAIGPVSGSERQTSQMTVAETTHTAALPGSFPQITAAMRLRVTGPNAGVYDILGAAGDSQGVTTRLSLRWASIAAEPGV